MKDIIIKMHLKKILLWLFIGIFLCLFFSWIEELWFNISKEVDPEILTYEQAYEIILESNIDENGNIDIDEKIYYKNEALFIQIENDLNATILKVLLEDQKIKPIRKKEC